MLLEKFGVLFFDTQCRTTTTTYNSSATVVNNVLCQVFAVNAKKELESLLVKLNK